jgi:hypothetical protein
MSYDHWKTTNPDDRFLGPEPEWPDELYPTAAEAHAAARKAGLHEREYRLFPVRTGGWHVEPDFFG